VVRTGARSFASSQSRRAKHIGPFLDREGILSVTEGVPEQARSAPNPGNSRWLLAGQVKPRSTIRASVRVGYDGKLASGLDPSRRCLAGDITDVRGLNNTAKARPVERRGGSVSALCESQPRLGTPSLFSPKLV